MSRVREVGLDLPGRIGGRLARRAERSIFTRAVSVPIARRIRIAETAGVPIIGAATVALVWANSPWAASYAALWNTSLTVGIGSLTAVVTLRRVIDVAALPLFFLTLGLDIRHEVQDGHLDSPKRAALPLLAAVGGMLIPAALYLLVSGDGPLRAGFGIPVATDVPFSLAVLLLLGNRVPQALKALLLGFAAADSIGGVLLIAVFYGSRVSLPWLGVAVVLIGAAGLLARTGPRLLSLYVILGLALWIATLAAGINPVVAGVALGLLIPTRSLFDPGEVVPMARSALTGLDRADTRRRAVVLGGLEAMVTGSEPLSERLGRRLRPWVSYVVLPLFALATAGAVVSPATLGPAIQNPAARGVAAGLVLGKPIGVLAACWIGVRLDLVHLPASLTWRHVAGVSVLAGIGFTVALFIAKLAFQGPTLEATKLAILASTLAAGLGGVLVLWSAGGEPADAGSEPESPLAFQAGDPAPLEHDSRPAHVPTPVRPDRTPKLHHSLGAKGSERQPGSSS